MCWAQSCGTYHSGTCSTRCSQLNFEPQCHALLVTPAKLCSCMMASHALTKQADTAPDKAFDACRRAYDARHGHEVAVVWHCRPCACVNRRLLLKASHVLLTNQACAGHVLLQESLPSNPQEKDINKAQVRSQLQYLAIAHTTHAGCLQSVLPADGLCRTQHWLPGCDQVWLSDPMSSSTAWCALGL